MDFMQNLLTRRSVRKYSGQAVEKEKVEQLLRAAMQAPSAGNGQPWHFIILTNRELLKAVPEFHPYAKMLPQAALGILVCGDEKSEKYAHRWPPTAWVWAQSGWAFTPIKSVHRVSEIC